MKFQILHFLKVATVSGPEIGVSKDVAHHRNTKFILRAVHYVQNVR
jgi:hypothetical protein